ncbi:hypothetical protein RFI_12847 [Reticulomyxa filosa]|uniref:Coiled-coil domain-containing protein 22 homolog n=1 Tax=Reticulomyxa filosa TaxID=46433 RepID=X6NEJ1_RETFI|nr:hypothetical protein RFI_12847 [Reticulomyxa filosa]|eukprot:ETO24313.1 hypothetical protein RFI_12847 [Reticulomyxa filosa]
MEEADKIIIPILKSAGCKLDDSIRSMSQFTAPLVVHCCATCLNAMDSSNSIPTELPKHSKTQQFGVGNTIKMACIKLGYPYPNDIGYETFIYPNEQDTRKILRWLVEKLQKHSKSNATGETKGDTMNLDEDEQEMLGGRKWLDKQILENLKQWTQSPYSFLTKPQMKCAFKSVPIFFPLKSGPLIKENKKSNTTIKKHFLCIYMHMHMHMHMHTCGSEQEQNEENGGEGLDGGGHHHNAIDWKKLIGESIKQELSQFKRKIATVPNAGIHHGTSLSRAVTFTQAPKTVKPGGKVEKDETEEEVEKRRNEELDELRSKIQDLEAKLKAMEEEIKKEKQRKEELEKTIEQEKKQNEQLQEELNTKEKVHQLIGGSADENIKKLEEIVKKQRDKLKNAVDQWENRKQLWTDEYRSKKTSMERREKSCNDLLEELKLMRKEMKQCAKEIREKEDMLEKVVARLNKLPKTFDRQAYVDRILNVVANLETQNRQIKQALEDIHELQRETNKVTEKSKRAFNICDDMIFQAAQNAMEENAKKQLNKCYRNVVAIREQFDKIVETTKKTSNIQNEIRDLQSQLQALQSKVETLDIEKVKQDAKEVADENEELTKKLKTLKKQLKSLN